MTSAWLVAPLAALALACAPDAPDTSPALESARQQAAQARAEFEASATPAGTLAGLVLFDGLAAPRVPLQIAAEGGCGLDPNEPALSEVLVVDSARVANVFVWLENPPSGSEPASAVRELTQRGCVYRPHALGIQVGETMRVHNADRARHNVHARPERDQNPSFNESQAEGAPPLEVVFHAPEVAIPIVCDLHPWMKAWVGVFEHPFFAVTGADGRFAWNGLPPGEYQVRAWHESLGRLSANVTVPAERGAVLCFTFQRKN